MAATLASTTHFDPLLAGRDRSADWEQGISFEDFLPTADANDTIWASTWKRSRLTDDLAARAEALSGTWKLLALSADWCIDAANSLPHVARLTAETDGLELRLLERDDHLDLMDEHLTNGARSFPVVILLDAEGKERAWWGSRPADLQAWVTTVGKTLPSDDKYREIRTWYVRDRGRTTLHEIVSMIERASGGTHVA